MAHHEEHALAALLGEAEALEQPARQVDARQRVVAAAALPMSCSRQPRNSAARSSQLRISSVSSGTACSYLPCQSRRSSSTRKIE
jgi:hypothetical protein